MRPDISQIAGFVTHYVPMNVASVTGSSVAVTTALTTAANTAGKGNSAVPFQQASATQMGFATTGSNIVMVFDATTKERIKDANNNRVYGKLTWASSVYTVSFFVFVGGAETTYTFGTATGLDLLCPYQFEWGNIREDFSIRLATLFPGGDDLGAIAGGGAAPVFVDETIAVTGTNTFATLSVAPNPVTCVSLQVNGVNEDCLSGGAFTLGGTGNRNITWNAANAGYSVPTTYRVVARYRA
jgi:hypothetical protein